jgi:hypothetical protein
MVNRLTKFFPKFTLNSVLERDHVLLNSKCWMEAYILQMSIKQIINSA